MNVNCAKPPSRFLDDAFVEELRRRRRAYLEAPEEDRAAVGLAYAEAQVEALRRLADKILHRHWPVAAAGQAQRAHEDFLALLRWARECQASIRGLPSAPYGDTHEQAQRAFEINARRGRLLRIVGAIVDNADAFCKMYDGMHARRIAVEWRAISERLSGEVASLDSRCHRVHRPQGPRTRRVAFRRTTRGSPSRPDDPAPARGRHQHDLDRVAA